MKTLKTIALSISLVSASMNVQAWTPKQISEGYNGVNLTELALVAGYVAGTKNTIETIQDFGFIPRNICFPYGETMGEVREVLNTVDYRDFPPTDNGGVIMIYSVYFDEHGC